MVTTQARWVPRQGANGTPDQFDSRCHRHPWPDNPSRWDHLSNCVQCGITLLRLFRYSSTWVVRRVESVKFIDDCTVRRCVSIDYEAPPDAVVFQCPDEEEVRILPLAILRRKSLVNFDFRDHEGNALPLVGLRQNQALTLALARAWAMGAASDGQRLEPLEREVDEFLDDVVAGDQTEMRRAFKRMWDAQPDTPLQRLGTDQVFRVTVDRLADSFILFYLHRGPVGQRRVIKFSYDEPFTLRYYKSSYHRVPCPDNAPGGYAGKDRSTTEPKEKDENTRLHRWSWPSLQAAMGFSPTLIEFPVPAAELAASFHFQISAPPEVSIAGAALLAGRPHQSKWEDAQGAKWEDAQGAEPTTGAPGALMKPRKRQRPSFDRIGGGYPTVDLHLAEVPYGSRSHARVKVEARVGGWFSAAVLSSWVATAVLLLAWQAKPKFDVGSALLMSFAAGFVAILVRPDPHRLVTRLLSKVRSLATTVALLSFAAAAVVAFASTGTAHAWLKRLFVASLVATVLLTLSWVSAVLRRLKDDPQESPWEHRRPRFSESRAGAPDDAPVQAEEESPHEILVRRLEDADYPYDFAFKALGFHRPAIRVASCEGSRSKLVWSRDFSQAFDSRLLRLQATAWNATAATPTGPDRPTASS